MIIINNQALTFFIRSRFGVVLVVDDLVLFRHVDVDLPLGV